MNTLDNNVLVDFFSFLGGRELTACCVVCKLWRRLIGERDEFFWKRLCALVWQVHSKELILCTSSWKSAYLNIIKLKLPPFCTGWKYLSKNTGGLLCSSIFQLPKRETEYPQFREVPVQKFSVAKQMLFFCVSR